MSGRKRSLSSISSSSDDDEPISVGHRSQYKRQKLTNQIIENLENNAENKKFNDIEFIIGTENNQQIFSANRLIFSTQSKVFEAMLFGLLSNSKNEPISIPDIKPAAFDYLHQLFYLKSPKLTNNIIIDVLYAAQKYMIHHVIKACKEEIYSINNMNDIYTVLISFGKYAATTFDEFIQDILKKTKFLKQNIKLFLDDSRFILLPIFMVQYIIKSTLISTEETKYEQCKIFSIQLHENMDRNINNNEYDSWKQIFIENFLNIIDLQQLSADYLLFKVRYDDILSTQCLLDILSEKTSEIVKKGGFELYDILLPKPERKSLKIGDLVDCRDLDGKFYETQIMGKNDHYVQVQFIKYPLGGFGYYNINDWQWFAKYRSVSGLKQILRKCMNNIKRGDLILVNYSYHPNDGDKWDNKWTKCKIINIINIYEICVCPILNDQGMPQKYIMHRESENECRCIDLKCKYCI